MSAFRIFFLSFLLFVSSSILFALNVPPKPTGYVNDRAALLSAATRNQLERELKTFEAETSNQIVVVTIASLEEENLEDFSIRLAEQWKIGQKGKDNGVILLISREDRAARIEVGYGLEGALPDLTAKLIIERELLPRFREGKFDEGVQRAVQAVIAATKGEYQAENPVQSKTSLLETWVIMFGLISLIIGLLIPLFIRPISSFQIMLLIFSFVIGSMVSVIFLFFCLFLTLANMGRKGSNYTLGSPGRKSSDWGGFSSGSFPSGGGRGFGGGGGSFGGGGASGRW